MRLGSAKLGAEPRGWVALGWIGPAGVGIALHSSYRHRVAALRTAVTVTEVDNDLTHTRKERYGNGNSNK